MHQMSVVFLQCARRPMNWGAIVHWRVNGDVAGQVKTFAQLSIGELCRGVGDLDFREVGGM